MKVKEESEKAGLKLNIQKTKIMASVPSTSGQIEVEKVEAVTDFIFLDSRITVDGGCSLEIKRLLLHGRKAVTNLDGVLEKAVAPHSSTLAWRIPWTEEPGGLQSTDSQSRTRPSDFTFFFFSFFI